MAQIKIKTTKAQDLTRIAFFGKVTGESIIKALKCFYDSEITSKVIWDFSNCDVTQVQKEDLFSIIEVSKSYAHMRVDGKTALVVDSDLPFGIARMHKTLADLDRYPIRIEIFRSGDDALAWLNS